MLTLRRLELEGFGPFADRQTLNFPSSAGVTVIYGENMRGKTTLLNAIRYAFFGTALGRGARTRRLHTISNRDRAVAGIYGFEVSLTFVYEGDEYELSRTCEPKIDSPSRDTDYSQRVLLRRGNAVLGPHEREKALELIFPSEVSRFFLFDGELLQEYEELLINESEAGHRISEAIERILGVPILKRARAHLKHLSEDADKQAAREALKYKDTEVVGSALQQATDQREAHQKEIQRLQDDLTELIAQRSELELYLQANEKLSALLQARDTAKDRVARIEAEDKRHRSDLQRAMADAWRALVRERVRDARLRAHESVREQVEVLETRLRHAAIEFGHCPICDQDVPNDVRERLSGTIPDEDNGGPVAEDVSRVMSRASELDRFRDSDNASEVRGIWKAINELALERVTLQEKIADLTSALSDADPLKLRESNVTFGEIVEKISVVKRGLEDERARVEELDQNIQRLKRKLDEASKAGLRESQQQARILRESADVLSRAVEAYKADLRSRVESTASDLFLAMTTEERDYAGLSINEAYGLTIRHQDGRAEEARSAGAEHVVALALMGALQRNAPLRGPIVMDSPFGRLDERHTENVVKALPKLADQVILLVYEAEVGRALMRELLGASLLREYELERQSARRTIVREVR
jgi:DNA sulfur modification protein DndD